MTAFSELRINGKRSSVNHALPFSPSPLKKQKSQFRPFNLVKSISPPSSHVRDWSVAMGNFFSLIFGKSNASTSQDSSENILGFQQYRTLVGETPKPEQRLVTRQGLDARRIVEKVPAYKKLYEATTRRDERLTSLYAEVKSIEGKLVDLRKEAHIIDVEEEEEEVEVISLL